MTHWESIWNTKTDRFTVVCEVAPEDCNPREHFDDEAAADIESGRFDWFQVRVRVLMDHRFEIGADYLGCCCYRTAREFAQGENRDGYFRDMVREAIANARTYLRKYPLPYNRATAPFVDVSTITEYGLTQKLSNSIRVF